MPDAITVTLNDEGKITSVDWEAWILNEIDMPVCTRDMVAKTYSYLLRGNEFDVRKVNLAIIERWSPAALRYIKEKAWKLAAKENH